MCGIYSFRVAEPAKELNQILTSLEKSKIKCAKCGNIEPLNFAESIDARQLCGVCGYATPMYSKNIIKGV